MPLTPHGERMIHRMTEEYGDKKGKSVFYASVNAGKPGFSNAEPARHTPLQRAVLKHKASK